MGCCCSPFAPPPESSVEVLTALSGGLAGVNVPAQGQGVAIVDIPLVGVVATDAPIITFTNVPNPGIAVAYVWPLPGGGTVRVGFVNVTAADQPIGNLSIRATVYKVSP